MYSHNSEQYSSSLWPSIIITRGLVNYYISNNMSKLPNHESGVEEPVEGRNHPGMLSYAKRKVLSLAP